MADEQLIIEPAPFAEAYGQSPIHVRHRLAEHPLLTVDALADLADSLPIDRVEHNMGKVPTVLVGSAPTLDLPSGEIARGIESNGCWMVLKNIEQNPAYRDLLYSTLDEVVSLIQGREGSMQDREGFVFLSAPGSVTPSHVDPEHNFLLQIRGTKDFHVGRFPDAETEQRDLEQFYGGGSRNIDHLPADVQTFALGPGDGVYVPPNAPHWVQNGDLVSVSLSITWRTPVTDRVARVHGINARLRRLHLSPRAPSGDSVRDRAKASLSRSLATIRRVGK
jgi:hypothetical protein